MMCSKLLRSSTKESKLTHTLDQAFVWLSNRYQAVLRATLRAPWVSVAACVAIAFGAYVLLQAIPQEYAPVEDRGQFNGQIQAPEGTSYERLRESAMKVEAALQTYFDDGSIQRGIVSVPGWGNNGSGIVNVTLKPFGERKIGTQEMLNDLNKQWEEIPDVRVNAFMSSGNRGGGGGGGGGSPGAARARRPELRRARALARHHHRARVARIRASCGSIRICARRSRRCSCASTRTAPRASA